MILDEIVLHDFGVYGGHQSINLAPVSKTQPIILFGGLNGGGKTTLLDALQLCLFGNMAKCAGRGQLNYDEYLRRSIHNQAIAPEAAVELAFRHKVDGEMQNLRLTRSWSVGETVRERFSVTRNGVVDKAASDHWGVQVEDFIPARIADLFLFDGEKVEGYADLDQAPGLIKSAVQNLLGLDVVERLGSDLNSIERRKKADLKTPEETEALGRLRDEIQKLATERGRLVVERAAATVEIDRLRRRFEDLDAQYDKEGGSIFEDRGRLEAELAVAERGLDAMERSMRELASGAAPLRLVSNLLEGVHQRAIVEDRARRSLQTAEVVAEEHDALLGHPALRELSKDVLTDLKAHASERLSVLRAAASEPILLNLEAGASTAISDLIRTELVDIGSASGDLLKEEALIKEQIRACKSLLAAVPNQSAIAELQVQREAARDSLKIAEYEQSRRETDIGRFDRDIAAKRERETKLLESSAREQFEQDDVRRVLIHSSRVRDTLELFREAVVKRHVSRIEGFVLESFQHLIRKPTLVSGLKIDPHDFTIELSGSSGQKLTSDRLSAGERQLLAIALLWGLAKTSGRPLPTVIDTPLGRLDSEHRTRLVKRYFPFASHQVLLLSTDEEITRGYYDALKPMIGRSYRLHYDQGQSRTIVEDGYFEGEEGQQWQ
ncbi:DNA sulfur modification protein DndD [Agrobacterium larrymoorei]|uniref:DNA sulfur modification protein DndD n=1 Tax=Agrobacterium larrymoorei TaxID=160699 RepID=A0A4D7E3X9_9HYPH|nr:DNA sulfur modification protein DndD [Agrobacterium larrymoorei]QCJ00893.1 DNA sulfur modification protein DndD [Agrobacterium larrymoorei]QYA10229.1 DNA sulfur modification protein DndD [Agrobacterium larrymoorei]